MIEHDIVGSQIDKVVSATGNLDQVGGRRNALHNAYDKISLVPLEILVTHSKQPIGWQTNILVVKLEFLQRNNKSLR